jgi:oxygen-independent coproporphyrinogen-3 oxidase
MSFLAKFGDSPYQGYAYGYPHKLAYRAIEPSLPLAQLWQEEEKDSLFLYVHLPFCEMRCGFCNLFTTSNPDESLVTRYIEALKRQMIAWSQALGKDAQMSRVAFGGGTPTFLSESELEDIFVALNSHFQIQSGAACSVEMSPGTVTRDKLRVLLRNGMTRASIGIQSFLANETRQLGRFQDTGTVHRALQWVRDCGVAVLNIDLIYGIEGQTLESWRESLLASLAYRPEEIYLYPLYVRPLTGLDRIGRRPTDQRITFYRAARDLLQQNGYRQISMRLFRAKDHGTTAGPAYCCQEDGMVGLGAGARSYTKRVHFSTEYAVGQTGIREIIADFNQRSKDDMTAINYGCLLNLEEQKRRYMIKSLLRIDGLDLAAYRSCFGSKAWDDFPPLAELLNLELGTVEDQTLRLNERGFELSDVIGPWLYSEAISNLIREFELK